MPHLRAYPVETVIAEKFNAMVTLGIANTRLKDFYDLWLISRTFSFQQATLFTAVQRTFERRKIQMPATVPTGLTDEFAEQWAVRWKSFMNRERMRDAPEQLEVLIRDLRGFLLPLLTRSAKASFWPPGGPWTMGNVERER